MGDPNAIEISLGLGIGVVGLPFLVFRIMKTLRDLYPNLQGQAAIRTVYAISAFVAILIMVIITAASDLSWDSEYDLAQLIVTIFLAWVVWTTGIAEIAKGYYADLFKQSVPGLPSTEEKRIVSVKTETTKEKP